MSFTVNICKGIHYRYNYFYKQKICSLNSLNFEQVIAQI